VLPFRHSRHRLPLICTDPTQLAELTQQLLEAPLGGVFRYTDGRNSRDEAWQAANDAVQRLEFLMRGHAHTLPGTQWNRWLPSSAGAVRAADPDPAVTIAAMESLVDRLWEEGHSYMAVRAARMEEVHGPKAPPPPPQDGSTTFAAAPPTTSKPELGGGAASESSDADEEESSDSSSDDDDEEDASGNGALELAEFFGHRQLVNADVDDDDEADDVPSYVDDFSLPGPTTHMYDILLDSMACFPTEPQQGYLVLQTILGRHGLDGCDEHNTNLHTRPTVMSYNAPIRLAASLPYSDLSSSSHAQLRDEALQLALGSFDALSHSTILDRNSATYAHLLRAIAKYIPSGTTRGNISLGIFHHARVQGLVDDAVLDAFLSAHHVHDDATSNGDAFDNWIAKHLGSPPVREAKELPHRWRRHGRIRRFHPREETY
jgi:hypothetical protein